MSAARFVHTRFMTQAKSDVKDEAKVKLNAEKYTSHITLVPSKTKNDKLSPSTAV